MVLHRPLRVLSLQQHARPFLFRWYAFDFHLPRLCSGLIIRLRGVSPALAWDSVAAAATPDADLRGVLDLVRDDVDLRVLLSSSRGTILSSSVLPPAVSFFSVAAVEAIAATGSDLRRGFSARDVALLIGVVLLIRCSDLGRTCRPTRPPLARCFGAGACDALGRLGASTGDVISSFFCLGRPTSFRKFFGLIPNPVGCTSFETSSNHLPCSESHRKTVPDLPLYCVCFDSPWITTLSSGLNGPLHGSRLHLHGFPHHVCEATSGTCKRRRLLALSCSRFAS